MATNYMLFVCADGETFIFKIVHSLMSKEDESEVKEDGEEHEIKGPIYIPTINN